MSEEGGSSSGPPEIELGPANAIQLAPAITVRIYPTTPPQTGSPAYLPPNMAPRTQTPLCDPDQASFASTETSGVRGPLRPNLDNPLLIYTPTELDAAVSQFAHRHGLTHVLQLLQRSAHLARDKESAMVFDERLSPEEREAILCEETSGFWRQSKYLKASILVTSLSGMIQGWTQSNSNAANAGMPAEFGLRDLWLLGFLNSSFFWGAGLLGTSLADPLQEYLLGRRGAIFVSGVLTLGGTIGATFSRTTWQLFGCRLVTGVAIGTKASVAPIYTAEVAPNHIRGELLANWQLADALGIFIGFAFNLIIFSIPAVEKIAWRLQTVTVLIPTVFLLLIVYLVPEDGIGEPNTKSESPRFLMKHGKYHEALEAFRLLRPGPAGPLMAARDMYYAHAQLEVESRLIATRRISDQQPDPSRALQARLDENPVDPADPEDPVEQAADIYLYQIRNTGYWQRFRQLFSEPRCRRASLCAATAMLARQFTGINTIGGWIANPRIDVYITELG
ncbi:hypothetical protein FGG08_002515 [Glutinoglossum americanum]|uniref:Major facilitator superfamily (MFS) profile domain-containing protein n=1 Tax=Glutinoglossum americanum TaxID=1670608 RepID=A0A9P8I027_9PEZI|nr:hypothetical protein FGG08_002515 [Glutinoglossum americanum]